MPTISLWNTETGEELVYETVDAKEVLRSNPGLYTKVSPYPPLPPLPRNVVDDEFEYRREPVGENPPERPSIREVAVIRNGTGAPRLR